MSDTPKIRTRPPPSRRRDKPQLSCNLCRRRKLKCNREQPCDTCSNRGLAQSCTYVVNPAQRQASRRSPSAQDRIQHLEGLVVSLMEEGAKVSPTQETHITTEVERSRNAPDSSSGATQNSAGHPSSSSGHGSMKFDDSGAKYVGSSHWAAVLDGIADLKGHLEREDDADVFQIAPDSFCPGPNPPQLLSGYTQHLSKEGILASIPARSVVDRLLSRYFNSFEVSPAIIHSVQFLKEYEKFWEDPPSTPTMWLGILFAIMCLAAGFEKFRVDTIASTELNPYLMVETFRQRTVQCLISGNYLRGGPYVLETLMLYFTNEYFLCKDADFGLWTLFGVIVQFAMRMGYHRDPKHFRGMPLLASEMRRRVWASIVQIDTSISIQMGLPRLIKPWQADTEEPRNLLDKDLDQNTTELPKERAATEITPMLYWILKGRLIAVLGSISDFTADTRPYTYADVMKLEGKLEDTRSSIPECLRWRSITQCVTESPLIIVQKMFLELTFYNAKIILHRKYLFLSPIQSHDYSVDVCVDSALRILEFQHMLDEETQPFGQLYQERWRATSIVNHVFLLATSILCFYLQRSQSHAKSRDPAEETRLEKIQGSLRRSQDIWLRSSGTSREAQKGARALGVMLKKLDSADTSGAQKNPTADLPQLPDDNDSAWFQGYLPGFNQPYYPLFGEAVPGNFASQMSGSQESFPGMMPPNLGFQMPDATRSPPGWPWNIQ